MSSDSSPSDSVSPVKKTGRVAASSTKKTAKRVVAKKAARAVKSAKKHGDEVSELAAVAGETPAATGSTGSDKAIQAKGSDALPKEVVKAAPKAKVAEQRPSPDKPETDTVPSTRPGDESSAKPANPGESANSNDQAKERSEGWPEPETIQGGENPPSGGKRKRRRKKKGGQGGQQGNSNGQSIGTVSDGATHGKVQGGSSDPNGNGERPSNPSGNAGSHGPRVPVDPEQLSKKAWKIFLAEVSEEGLALISDQDARELSRRCFKVAEIFLEEQGRRLR